MQDLFSILGLKSEPVSSGLRTTAPDETEIASAAEFTAARATGNVSSLRRLSFAVVFTLTACATASAPGGMPAGTIDGPPLSPYARALSFALDAPAEDALGPTLKLWATHYHTPEVTPATSTISAAFPLLGRNGAPISPPLPHRDWCEAALQGSVSVKSGGVSTAYVFVDANGPEQANCDQWLGSLSDGVKNATRHARFKNVNHALGCGVRNLPLLPFRTIAVDPDIIPLESVVFVPELRGRAFRQGGRDLVHDGYLFAGDRGGAIKGRHIDVFLNEATAPPLEDLFASTDTRTFTAHIVAEADPMAQAIRATQSSHCEDR
jgi:3D (Asp-Asp-Asp) domain-containing protein